MQTVKLAAVRREAYHRAIMHFTVDGHLITIRGVSPHIGPVPDIRHLIGTKHSGISNARKAIREAMKLRDAQDPSCVTISPQQWIQCVLAMDDALVEVGMDFNDCIDAVKLQIKRDLRDPDNRIDTLYAQCEVGNFKFSYAFGVIDWNTYTLK